MKSINMLKKLALCATTLFATLAWAAEPTTVVVAPLCSATEAWSQTGTLNAVSNQALKDEGYSFESFCGCDPLAWGQVAVYHAFAHGSPTNGWTPAVKSGTVQVNDGTQTTQKSRSTKGVAYNWTNVRDLVVTGSASVAAENDAGRLMYDLGVIGGANYSTTGTAGTASNTGVADYFEFKGTGYKYTFPLYWNAENVQVMEESWPNLAERIIRGSLHAGAPLVLSINLQSGGMHMIVCDGYGYAEDGTLMLHFNYGWGTDSDKWVDFSFFTTKAVSGVESFNALYANVHPNELGCVLAGRVVNAGVAQTEATVTLSVAGQEPRTTTTDSTGSYCFTGCAVETEYTVTVTSGNASYAKTVTTEEFVDDTVQATRQDQDKENHVFLEGGNALVDFDFATDEPTIELPKAVYTNALEGLDWSLVVGDKTYQALQTTALTTLEEVGDNNFDRLIYIDTSVNNNNDTRTHTFSMWVKVESLANDQLLWWVCGGNTGTHAGYAVKAMANGQLRVGKASGGGAWCGGDYVTRNFGLQAGVWTHITLVVTKRESVSDRNADFVLYKNGERVSTGSFPTNLDGAGGSATTAQLGANISATGIAVYDSALTDEQVDAMDRTANLVVSPAATTATVSTATATDLNWDNGTPSNALPAVIKATTATTITTSEAVECGSLRTDGSDITLAGSEVTATTTVIAANTNVAGITASLGSVTILYGKKLTISANTNLSSLSGGGDLVIDATMTASDELLEILRTYDGKVTFKGETTLVYAATSSELIAQFIYESGTHYLKYGRSIEGGFNFATGKGDDAPTIRVKTGATLNMGINDLSGWQGSVAEKPAVIRVANGATLNWMTYSNGYTGFFRDRLILDGGATVANVGANYCFILHGGAVTDPAKAQIAMLDSNTAVSATFNGIIPVHNYKSNGGGAGTTGASIAVGRNATLNVDTLKGENETLRKLGSGILAVKTAVEGAFTFAVDAGTLAFKVNATPSTTFTGSGTIMADGCTLDLSKNATLTNFAGSFAVANGGTLILPAGKEGNVVVPDGCTLKLVLSEEQLAGYYLTEASGEGTIVFVNAAGDIVTEDIFYVSDSVPIWTPISTESLWSDTGLWNTTIPTSGTVVINALNMTEDVIAAIPTKSAFSKIAVWGNFTAVAGVTFTDEIASTTAIEVAGRVYLPANVVADTTNVTITKAGGAVVVAETSFTIEGAPKWATPSDATAETKDAHDNAISYAVRSDFIWDDDIRVKLDSDSETSAFVFGGYPKATVADVNGDIWLNVTGGNYSMIVGGSNANDWGTTRNRKINGDVFIEMVGGTANYLLGGFWKDGSNTKTPKPTITGDLTVLVREGASVAGSLFGGSLTAHNNGTVLNGSTHVIVQNVQDTNSGTEDGALKIGYIGGGDVYMTNASPTSTINGSTNLTVDLGTDDLAEGATFVKNLVGGSVVCLGGASRGTPNLTVNGNTIVEITAPSNVTFSGNIYGGSFVNGTGNLPISGNTSVVLNGGIYTGTIVAGSSATTGSSAVSGTATLILRAGNFTDATLKPVDGSATVGSSKLVIAGNIDLSAVKEIGAFTTIEVQDGATLIASNELALSSVTVVGNATITIAAEKRLLVDSLNFTNYNTLTLAGAGTLAFTADVTPAGAFTGTGVIAADSCTLDLAKHADIAGFAGSFAVANGGTIILPAGEEGNIAVPDGCTLNLVLDAEALANGYESTAIGKVAFVKRVQGQYVAVTEGVTDNVYTPPTPTISASFGVNFTHNENSAPEHTVSGSTEVGFAKDEYTAPLVWADITGSADGAQTIQGAYTVRWTARGSYRVSAPASTTLTTDNQKLLYGYLDDNNANNNANPTVTITGLPDNKQYAVALIFSGDAANNATDKNAYFAPVIINGETYSYNSEKELLIGSASATKWGSRKASDATTLVEGTNVLFVEGLSGSILSIECMTSNSKDSRLTIAGVQVWVTSVDAIDFAAPKDKETISLNFHSGESSNAGAVGEAMVGIRNVAAWNDLTGASGSGTSLRAWNGSAAIDVPIVYAFDADTTWGYTTNVTDNFLKGYLDDGTHNGVNGATITLSAIPFETYSVIVYCATDTASASFRPVQINGTWYAGSATATNRGYADIVLGVEKEAISWGASRNATAVYGTNAIRVDNLSGNLTIQGLNKTGSNNEYRGGIAAVQIINTSDSVSLETPVWTPTAENQDWNDLSLWSDTLSVPSSGKAIIDASAVTQDVSVEIPSQFDLLEVRGPASAVATVSFSNEATASIIVLSGRVAVPHSVLVSSTIIPEDDAIVIDIVDSNVTWNANVTSLYNFGKKGAGKLTMNAALTGSKSIHIFEGALELNNKANGEYGGTYTIDQNATLAVVNSDANYNPIGGSSAKIVNNGLVQYLSGTNGHFAGIISGSGKVQVDGGAFELSGNNTYAGGTEIAEGATLTITHNNALGPNTGTNIISGAGNIVCATGKYPVNQTGLRDSENWTGSLSLTNVSFSNFNLGILGNKNSTLVLNNATAFIDATSLKKLVLEGDFQINNGYSTGNVRIIQVGTLEGSGALKGPSDTAFKAAYYFADATKFSGTIDLSNEKASATAVVFGEKSDNFTPDPGSITILSGEVLTTAAALKTAGDNGVIVAGAIGGTGTISGALTFNNGATLDASAGALTANTLAYGDNAKITIQLPEDLSTPVLKTTSTTLPAKYTLMQGENAAPTYMLVAKTVGEVAGFYAVEPTVPDVTVGEGESQVAIAVTASNLAKIQAAAAAAGVATVTEIVGAQTATGTVDVAGLELFENIPVEVDTDSGVATISYTFGVSGLTALSATTITENEVTTTTYTLVAKVELGDGLNFANGVTVGLVDADGNSIANVVSVTDMTGKVEEQSPSGNIRYFKYTIGINKGTSSNTFKVRARATNEAQSAQ